MDGERNTIKCQSIHYKKDIELGLRELKRSLRWVKRIYQGCLILTSRKNEEKAVGIIVVTMARKKKKLSFKRGSRLDRLRRRIADRIKEQNPGISDERKFAIATAQAKKSVRRRRR